MSPFNSISVTNVSDDGMGGMIITFTATIVLKADEANKKEIIEKKEIIDLCKESKENNKKEYIDLWTDSDTDDDEEFKRELLRLTAKKREAEKKAKEAEKKATENKIANNPAKKAMENKIVNNPAAPKKPRAPIKKEATKKASTKKKVASNKATYPPLALTAPRPFTNLTIYDEDEPDLDFELSQQQGW
jgi:hypothetical protein